MCMPRIYGEPQFRFQKKYSQQDVSLDRFRFLRSRHCKTHNLLPKNTLYKTNLKLVFGMSEFLK